MTTLVLKNAVVIDGTGGEPIVHGRGRMLDEETGGFDFNRWDLGGPGVGLYLGLVERHHCSVPEMFDNFCG